MEVYTTENEQVDALRRFLAENGKALVVGVVLGVGALIGWRFWLNHQSNSVLASSTSYQQISDHLASGKVEDISSAEKFAAENKNNYGVLASLELARHYVDQNDFAKAEQQLAHAQSQTKDADLLSLVNLRLARIQLQEQKADEALKTLDAVKLDGWVALAAEVRGDALASKGDNQAAREAYNKGLAANPPQALQALLRMKLNNLSS
ncbi:MULTISPECIES: YfgM family protein [unclassified Brenneria]|uniref:YfgM family protein n=1 Tax=unclassified Brenneria TaxID=2634434 RepID=UPI001557D1D2|nr:YfgM family protein [Brenneria sp. L3-3C-1]MEE3645126.1 YfgM family protein [Brenneria sp. L3_3C_1]MEE3652769.1 YfgM family protein [Brenneria sp. HEZEL_4_2_4]NPD02725.1 YfgM family protein [Brenneria sp. hezel4-2-4]MEE3652816.1 YfgM family protein [Brenneria sp. HEZEL_4_2_4]